MTTLIKWYQDLPSYTPINISTLEQMIDKMVENSIQKTGIRQDLVDLSQVVQGIGSSEFLKIYNDVLTDMLKEIPSEYFAGQNFFDPYGNPNVAVTTISKGNLNEDLDNAISAIRGLIKIAFPNGHTALDYIVNIKEPQHFLNSFANIMKDIGGGAYLDSLQEQVRGMAQKYGAVKTGDDAARKAFNTNLQNVTGQILWENISLKAREKTLKIYFNTIAPGIDKSFITSGGRIKVTGSQAGRKLSSAGKQEVADSIVTLSFRDEGDKEVLAVTMADSTKLSQTAMKKNNFYIGSTKTQSETYTVQYLLNSVGKQTYWEKRLQPYLGGAYEKADDKTNWDNTRQAFYLLALYDVLAVRATTSGTFAQTLTVNNKIQTINNIIRNTSDYYQYRSSGSKKSIRGAKNDIFNMGKLKHTSYIKKQQKISHGNNENDENQLILNYEDYIASVLATKINIGTNVLF